MNTLTTEHTPDNIIARWLDDHQEELVNTADYIFHHPELAYQETLSSKCLADYLESQGFKITWKTAGIDTAFTAVWGGGKPIPDSWPSTMLWQVSDTPAGTTCLEQPLPQRHVH